ncbi:3-oxoacyl-[acyl-carrier-protein] synthase, KASIII [Minicystis rosea]|nr:3-oxoacyl-[acyl-carrier-protein] synthase, KASIII [Minicystis rosea]
MSENQRVGILGVGAYLPPSIRKNDFWSQETVQRWGDRALLTRDRLRAATAGTEGRRLVLEAMESLATDPFQGSRERRVMTDGMASSDMEVAAAEDAIARAGVDRSEIDVLLVSSMLPDRLSVSNAAIVHRRLGLPKRCLSLTINAACADFFHQLAVAAPMVSTSAARLALLVQSNGYQHLCRPEDAHSAWFGDAATAAVVGPVSAPHGILAQSQRTDGRYHRALVLGSPSREGYASGGLHLHTEEPAAALEMLLDTADNGRDVVRDALATAGVKPEEVAFYASHQASVWFRPVTQRVIGLSQARSFDTFAWTASLGPSNVPLMLAMGERDGLLRAGDLVAMYGGGSGIVYSGAVMRWGR